MIFLSSFSEWMEAGNNLVTLITGLVGLIGTGIGVYYAIRNFLKGLKGKKASEIWALIQEIADAAMKEAEASGAKGADKKEMVINAVKAGCKAAGIEIADFIDQLSEYIDQTIAFVNDMKDKK